MEPPLADYGDPSKIKIVTALNATNDELVVIAFELALGGRPHGSSLQAKPILAYPVYSEFFAVAKTAVASSIFLILPIHANAWQ